MKAMQQRQTFSCIRYPNTLSLTTVYASSCSSSFTLLPSKSTLKQSSFLLSSNSKSQFPFLFDTLIKSNASSRSSTFIRSVIWLRRLSGGHALQSVMFDFSSAESTRSFAKFIRYRMSESKLIAPSGVNLLCCIGRSVRGVRLRQEERKLQRISEFLEQGKITLRIAPSRRLETAAKTPMTKLSESFGTRCTLRGSRNSSRLAHLR